MSFEKLFYHSFKNNLILKLNSFNLNWRIIIKKYTLMIDEIHNFLLWLTDEICDFYHRSIDKFRDIFQGTIDKICNYFMPLNIIIEISFYQKQNLPPPPPIAVIFDMTNIIKKHLISFLNPNYKTEMAQLYCFKHIYK